MKRKLNEQNVPSNEIENGAQEEPCSFASFGLDSRLSQAVAREGFLTPTLVQARMIPLALEGRDVLACAKTGSGKTVAYVLPILESILRRKSNHTVDDTSALILVPTRELVQQVSNAIVNFSIYCAKDIRTINIAHNVSEAVLRSLLAEPPDVIIATPASASIVLNTSALSFEGLSHLVIDEADVVLSYGYDTDLERLEKAIPKSVQTSLMSATMSDDVETLKGLFCLNPRVLELEHEEDSKIDISQYAVKCAEDEKFLLAYVIFKLKLIKGKCIIFVGDIDRCYRLKLFLEQFGIKSCVLNSELPVNTRLHVIEEFNKNVYEIIIASDEQDLLGERKDKHPSREDISQGDGDLQGEATHDITSQHVEPSKDLVTASIVEVSESQKPDTEDAEPPRKKKTSKRKGKEYSISRGVDFKNVACVINFDLPTSSRSYTHRIGRTARAGQNGMALSFVIPAELYHKHKPTTFPTAKHDEDVLEKISKDQRKKGKEVKPYQFDMKQVDGFRYRMTDALRAVTRLAIREARTRELRQELLKSEKLKRHFEENPDELHHLRHDGELRAVRVQPHLKHVPEYLLPSKGQNGIAGEDVGFVPMRKITDNRIRRAKLQNRLHKGKGKGKGNGKGRMNAKAVGRGRTNDPLKTFNAKG